MTERGATIKATQEMSPNHEGIYIFLAVAAALFLMMYGFKGVLAVIGVLMPKGGCGCMTMVVVAAFAFTLWKVIHHKSSPTALVSPNGSKFMQAVDKGAAKAQSNYQRCERGKDLPGRIKCDYKLSFDAPYEVMSSVLNAFVPHFIKCYLVTCGNTRSSSTSAKAGARPTTVRTDQNYTSCLQGYRGELGLYPKDGCGMQPNWNSPADIRRFNLCVANAIEHKPGGTGAVTACNNAPIQ